MSNPHYREYCDHREECKNGGCSFLVPVPVTDPEDIAYRDPIQCTRYKGQGGSEEGGKAVIITGLWKK